MEEKNSNKISNDTEQFLEKEEKETELSNINSKNTSLKNKSFFSLSLKKAIILLIIAIALDILRVIIMFLIKKKSLPYKESHNIIKNPDEPTSNSPKTSSISLSSCELPSSRESISSCISPSSRTEISSSSSSSSNYSPESVKLSDISFEEAEKFFDLKIIGKNHKILNESHNSITEFLKVFNNLATDLKSIYSNISCTFPEFKDNPIYNILKILEGNRNNLTEKVSGAIKNLFTPLNNIKKNVNKILEQFENITKYFYLPLLLGKNCLINSIESNNSRRRLYSSVNIQKYKDEIESLNNIYNSFFTYIKNNIEIIIENVKKIPNLLKEINENIKKGILDYGKLLGKFEKEKNTQKINENFLSINQLLLDIKENMNDKIQKIEDRITFLEDLHKDNSFNSKKFDNDNLNIIGEINRISEEIFLEINEIRKQNGEKEFKYKNTNSPTLIVDSIINSIDNSFKILIDIEIMKKNEILSIITIINVEKRIPLDLLYIIDVAGPMGHYVKEEKNNINDIINRIENRCPGIDVNLGFIEYRDEYKEDKLYITDIELTKDQDRLKNNISKIYVDSRGNQSEDISWAFEKALNITWKSNARFIIFVADKANHANKYYNDGDYLDDILDKRNLENIIKKLADTGVSLFCMKLTEDKDKMLEIFGDIYKNYEKSQFQIISIGSEKNFSDTIVDFAANVYENQRMKDVSISFEYNKNKLRIFLIEINPILTKITNKELYKNNNGHPYVSEYFEQDRELALKEMKEDLEFCSHGKIKIEIVTHIIYNDFPKYKKLIELSNGKRDYKLDEETYISMSKKDDNPDKGDWNKLINDPKYQEIDSFQFDYNYIVKKYKLDILRKNNTFDQVWIYGIDPLSTYETMIIGSNPFWVNGEPLKKDCKNFMVVAIPISRRDANLHAFGHSFEDFFSYAFTGESFSPDKEYNDDTQEKYDKLNYWEKFSLINKNSKGENAGVGNIHFPFNGETDYDYYNENKVYSNWEYWENYPNIKGEKKKYNNEAWMNFKGNEIIINDANSCKDPDRLYIRFWMYLLPHIDGYTETGQLNNWWDYITNCDYVTSIKSENKIISGTTREEVHITYKVFYKSGTVETIRNINFGKNVKINGDCVSFENNKLIGSKKGICSIVIYRDGNPIKFEINII